MLKQYFYLLQRTFQFAVRYTSPTPKSTDVAEHLCYADRVDFRDDLIRFRKLGYSQRKACVGRSDRFPWLLEITGSKEARTGG